MQIPVDSIEIPHQLRERPDPDHIAALAESIRNAGLLQPIIVTEHQGKYRLVAGYHRLHAVKQLGHTTIEAHVLPHKSDSESLTLQLTENITRKDMPLREQVNAIMHLHHTLQMPLQRIAQLTGRTVQWIKRRIDITGYPEDVQRALYDSKINLGQAELLARIDDDATRRQAITHAWQMGLTTDDLRNLIATLEAYRAGGATVEDAMPPAQEVESPPTPQDRCAICGRIRDVIEMHPALICTKCYTRLAKEAEEEARRREA